ncbi:MAG TPA: hypothetical protein VFR86_11190 [Burkholderiaceae bacterium]|nr:hypothetical protein [Burkholderiaceae bacterium]
MKNIAPQLAAEHEFAHDIEPLTESPSDERAIDVVRALDKFELIAVGGGTCAADFF